MRGGHRFALRKRINTRTRGLFRSIGSGQGSGGNISAAGWLENAAGNVNCPVMTDASQVYDTAVIGGGPARLTAPIALAEAGPQTPLPAPPAAQSANRTHAPLRAPTDLPPR